MTRIMVIVSILALAYVGALGLIELGSRSFAAPAADLRPDKASPVVAVAFYDDHQNGRRQRTATAAGLFRSGEADYLVMVGGWRPERNDYLGSRLMRDEALADGVTPDRVLYDAQSNDSVSNLAGASATIRNAIGTPQAIILVSDRYHLMRLSWLASGSGLAAPLRFKATPDNMTLLARLERLNYEALAYVSALLPRPVVSFALARMRLSENQPLRSSERS